MKKFVISFSLLLLCSSVSLRAQLLTVEECRQRAQEHYPLIKQYELIEKTKEYNLSNAGKGYLPQFSFAGKATYQSDVTKIPLEIPGMDIRAMRKDQYQATLQVDQMVWDGGAIQAQKNVTRATSDIDKQKWNVDMYAINERVNQLFFGILLWQEQLKQNLSLQQELQRNYENVKSYLINGIANQADVDAVRVEQLNAEQQRVSIKAALRAYCEMLKVMINYSHTLEGNELQKPDAKALLQEMGISGTAVTRPEISLFAAQNRQLEAQRQILAAKNLPHFGLFAQGAYGNPGLNMLKNEFEPYYVAGIRLSWNFGNLYTRKNEYRQITLNQQSVDARKETFLFNTQLEITQNNSEIKKWEELMKKDNEIITLRGNIKRSAQAKVANGTLTVTEMLREVTAEDVALQNKILHEIQLLAAIYELRNTTGQ